MNEVRPPRRADWIGSIAFGANWLLYCGQVGSTELHAHHAEQIIVSGEGDHVVVDVSGNRTSGSLITISSDVSHSIHRGAAFAEVLFVEPAVRRAYPSATIRLHRPTPPRPIADWHTAAARVDAILGLRDDGRSEAFGVDADPVRHPAVRSALDALPDLVATGRVSARDLAEVTGMSSSRLSHLFTQQTGVPIRRYVRWARVTLAAEHLSTGATLTEAAHVAGFSDGAHFSRTFRSMFGLSPTDAFAAAAFLHP